MPSKTMDQRRLPSMNVPSVSPSFFSDEIRFPAQRQVGFWKSESLTDNQEVMQSLSGEAISSEPFGLPMGSWSAANHGLNLRSNGLGQPAMFVQPDPLNTNENNIDLNEVHYESRLFSSSLPGILHKKYANGALFDQSVSKIDTNLDEENVTSESLKEIEAQTIGDLLPDDDDLFSGVIDAVKIEFAASTNNNDDVDDDLFYSGGGMELESNCIPNEKKADMNSLFGGNFIHSVCPSRTLFVNNIENIEDADLKIIFERYGDIHMLYTSCKPHGFVIVSYYDLRSACNAMKELQSKLVMNKKLDICFGTSKDNTLKKDNNQGMLLVSNLDSSVSNDHLNKIFGLYGEIKEIHDMPHKHQYKFIEFYDIRASEAALCGLNMSDIMGKRIQIEISHPGSARQLMQQDESNLYDIKGSPNSSPSLHYGGIPFGVVTSHSVDNGPLHGQHSLSQGSDSFPHYLSSPVNITSIGIHSNHPRIDDLNNSLGKLNFGLQCMPSFLSHSIPDHCDGMGNSNSYRSPNTTVSSMALNFVGHADGVDMHIPGRQKSAGINQQSFANSEQAFSSRGNSQHLLHGHQYIWNSPTSSPYHRTPGTLMWPNSPSQLHGHPRETSNMLNNILPLCHHHVGSAPTGNPSWDRNHSYSGDLTDSSVFHPGSLGNIGFSGSPLHTLEFASQNMFPQVGGNCIDNSISSPHVGLPSPQQKYRTLHGSRNPMIPMPTTFDSPTDRVRSRRNDVSSNQVDSKKQYELDIERIIRGEDSRTTLMIKNIPNKYTSKMLLAAIDDNHRGNYDFIYLPIDFKNKCNVGYAFINLIDPQQIITFYKAFNGKKWEKFNSEKVATLTYARIQGKAALIAHFQNSSLMNEDKRCRPILFRSDGPNAGDQEPFPTGMNIRSRSGRSRTQSNEDNYQASSSSPPNSVNVEEHSKDCNNSTTTIPKGNVSSQTHTAPV